ncbi:MAG: hypothetical protein ACK4Y5_20680 [Acetobacteraceae bacterium]|jgi:hypothetical protein
MARELSNVIPQLNDQFATIKSGTSGSPLFVLHADAKQVTTLPRNPYATITSTAAADMVCCPSVVNTGANFLDLYHLYRGADGTAPFVRVYGWVPFVTSRDANANLPVTLSSAFPALSGMWIPLQEHLTDALLVTFDSSAAVDQAITNNTPPIDVPTLPTPGATSIAFKLTARRSFFLSGATRVLVTVQTASTVGNESMVVGRFVC